MCTLDIMGYTSEQFFTVPYLVYIKSLNKLAEQPDKEINRKMSAQIEETCVKILETSKVFQEDTICKIVAFVNQPELTST